VTSFLVLIKMNKARYYELKESRSGIPFHWAHRFLRGYINGTLHYSFRNPIIHNIMRNVFPGNKDPNFRNIFEICFNLLDALNDEEDRLLMSFIEITSGDQMHFQVNLDLNRQRIKQVASNREKFIALTDYYVELYEGYYRCVSSIFLLAKMIHNRNPLPDDLTSFMNENVTAKLDGLLNDKGEIVPALPELCEGCERHLRNGISHNRWKMLGRKKIEVWDIKKNKVNWKAVYTLSSLNAVLDKLVRTIDAMDLAFMVYVNNIYKASGGVFAIGPGNDYDDEFVKNVIENMAIEFGLFAEACDYDGETDTLTISLFVPINHDIPQEGEIVEGSTRPAIFKQKMDVVEEKVINAVLNLLLITSGMLQSYSSVILIISSEERGEIGKFNISSAQMKEFYEGKRTYIEKLLAPLNSQIVRISVTGPSIQIR
jgi:hypothetical protein